jgi:NADH-quinone oxidoreductase subunit L
MIDFATHYPWLIPLFPLIACALIGAIGWKIRNFSHIPAILAMIASCVLALSLLFGIHQNPGLVSSLTDFHVFNWFSAGNLHVSAALTIDQLTAIYLAFITGIGTLIFIYAAGYMKGDFGFWRFFAYLSIFVFFMCCLVMGNSFLLLYLGWEGVGLASYLLIGYYYPRPAAVAAAKKAFITNRVGDFGLAIGIFLIYKTFGTLDYTAVFAQLHDTTFLAKNHAAIYWIPFCLMLGAFGKSAQFPLHVWLPDAMEGPTPVSALIHAATMVTAGIYLIARTMPLFLATPGNTDALNTVACVGAFTSFLAASIALCQYDLKRIWAYSTLSQLGYMFLALGVVAPTSAVFHVFTHAFFKALLFLSAGSVMHAMGGELDIRKMSGIRRVMPITNITMLIGCIALAGVPFLGAGYFSKDEIIDSALNSRISPVGFPLGIVGLVVALMTAFYTFRTYFRVFWGPLELPETAGHHEASPFALDTADGAAAAHATPGVDTVHAKQGHEEASHGETAGGQIVGAAHGHDQDAHGPNDGPPIMWLPLLVLSIGAVGAGYLGYRPTGDWFHHFLNPVLGGYGHAEGVVGEGPERVSDKVTQALGAIIPLVGIALAAFFFLFNRHAAEIVGRNLRPVVRFLYNKWYIDAIYAAFITKPLRIFSHIQAIIDRYLIDGIVFMVGFFPQLVGYSLKPTQRGLLQRYAVGMVAGLAIIIVAILYLTR